MQSSLEGVKKPDRAIYRRVLERLGVRAEEAVFLDDIGTNLKPARDMGIHTIKASVCTHTHTHTLYNTLQGIIQLLSQKLISSFN